MTHFRPRILKRYRRDADGAAAVEFAMVATVLTFFIMGVIELGLMMTAQGVLDNVVFSASRVGKTGYAQSGKTQGQTITEAVKKAASDYIDSSKIVITSKACSGYGNIGKPEPFTDTNKNGKRDSGEAFTDVNGNGTFDLDQGRTGYGAGEEIVAYTAPSVMRMTALLGHENAVAELRHQHQPLLRRHHHCGSHLEVQENRRRAVEPARQQVT